MRPGHWLFTIPLRLRSLFRWAQADQELDDELRDHLERKTEEYVARGMTQEEARRRARIDLGGVEQTKQKCRDARRVNWMHDFFHDLRFGLRILRKSPGFTAVAVLSIALGIGANTAIFSVIQALLLRWLPVPNPQELLQVNTIITGRAIDSFSYPVIRALAERKDVFENLGGYCGNTFTVGPPDAAVRTHGALVSGGFFPALQLQPTAGRLLTPEDDQPGAPLTAVISDGYWERNFHRDPRAIGATLIVEGHPVRIVGITPRGFTGANVGEIADLTMAFQARLQLSPERAGLLEAGNQYIRILARPAPGLTPDQVRARLKVLWPPMAGVGVNSRATPARRQAMLASTLDVAPGGTGWTPLRNQYTKPLYVLMFLSGLVLLVACANVANLLLARSAARRHEIAVRLAIGAGRGRIARQLLSESLLLAVMGAVLGLAVAQVGSSLLLRLASRAITLSVGVNGQVLAFALAVAVLTGLLFGLAPALRVTSAGPGLALKGGEETSSGSRGRLAPTLVAGQVAWSLLLLIGAGLFIRTLRNLQAIDPGFRHEGVMLLDVDARRSLGAVGPQGDSRIYTLFRESLNEISQLTGVTAASVSNFTPISGGFWSQDVLVDGQRQGGENPVFFAVSTGYFKTLQIPLAAGRDFTFSDDGGAPPVVIINEEFVRRFIPHGRPLGRTVSVADSQLWQNMQVIGVSANLVPYSLREPLRPCVFVPFFQQPPGRVAFGTFEIRAGGSLSGVSSAIEDTMRRRLPGVPLKARSFTGQVEDSIRSETLMAKLAGFFGGLALALAGIGVYGLLAYVVRLRTAEVGIRMALGAQRGQVLWLVLRSGLSLVVFGLALGLPAAWWASRLVSGLLFDLSPNDPLTIAASVLLLSTTALAASLLPARRATKVDPMVALRYE